MEFKTYPVIEINVAELDPVLRLDFNKYDDLGHVIGVLSEEQSREAIEFATGKKILRIVFLCRCRHGGEQRAIESAMFDPEDERERKATYWHIKSVIGHVIATHYWPEIK